MKKELVTYLKQARENKHLAKLRGTKLEVNGEMYTLNQLKEGAIDLTQDIETNGSGQSVGISKTSEQANPTLQQAEDNKVGGISAKRPATSPATAKLQIKKSAGVTDRSALARRKNIFEKKA